MICLFVSLCVPSDDDTDERNSRQNVVKIIIIKKNNNAATMRVSVSCIVNQRNRCLVTSECCEGSVLNICH